MDKLEQPAHKYGYTRDQIDRILDGDTGPFWRWMRGQTMMLDPELGTIVYSSDLKRYLEGCPIID